MRKGVSPLDPEQGYATLHPSRADFFIGSLLLLARSCLQWYHTRILFPARIENRTFVFGCHPEHKQPQKTYRIGTKPETTTDKYTASARM